MSEQSKPNVSENIQVCVRMKPMGLSGETETKAQIESENNTLIFPGNGTQKQVITFDRVFNEEAEQESIFQSTG